MSLKAETTVDLHVSKQRTHIWNYPWLWWLLGTGSVVLLAFILRFEPPDLIVLPWLDTPLPQTCWTRRWLGFGCPGCGLTRSFVLSAHGEFAAAFKMHPVGTVMFALLVFQLPIRIYQGTMAISGKQLPEWIDRRIPDAFRRGKLEILLLAIGTAISFVWWAMVGLLG